MATAVLLIVQGWGYSQFSVDGTYLLSFITTHISNWLSANALNASSPTTVKIYLVTEFVGHAVYALAFWTFTQIRERAADWRPLALLFTQFVLIWVCRLDLGYWTAFAIAVLLPLRPALAYFLVLLLGIWCARAMEAFVFHFRSEHRTWLVELIMMTLMITIAFSVGRLMAREKSMRLELAAAKARLEASHIMLERTAGEAERLRISRNLHDAVGHHLTALKLHLDLATRRQIAPDPSLQIARNLSAQALEQIRTVVAKERQAEAFDLRRSLEALSTGMPNAEHRLHVDAQINALPPAHLHTLYHFVQEALTNCAKHSHASHVDVNIAIAGGHVAAQVKDDGIGIDQTRFGNGLRGLAERAALLSGTLTIRNRETGGALVEVILPLTADLPASQTLAD
ncbi:MAG: sensor histidine kinase [Rhodocyclaceae bacterium]|nr:sensor histidine kinase [Rhodocyclaceae bacterium]